MRALAVSVLAFAAGCYGAGPVPGSAERAEIVFTGVLPDSKCGVGRSIGDLVFDTGDKAYAVLLPFITKRTCDSTFFVPTVEAEVWRFDDAGVSERIGTAGLTDGFKYPRLALDSSGAPHWGYSAEAAGIVTEVRVSTGAATSVPAGTIPPYFVDIKGLAIAGDEAFVAGGSPSVFDTEVELADFPITNGGSNPTGQIVYLFNRVKLSTGEITPLENNFVNNAWGPPHFFCSDTKTCLVQNSTSLVYFGTGEQAYVGMLPKASPTDHETVVESLPFVIDETLAGLAVDETHVVWGLAQDYWQIQKGSRQRCEIYRDSLTDPAQPATRLFSTEKFTCRDIVLDGNHVYFAIVGMRERPDDAYFRFFHGEGVGRLTLGSGPPKLETLRLGVTGEGLGPRRVFVRGDSLYLVDPLTVARITKSELDDKTDFEP